MNNYQHASDTDSSDSSHKKQQLIFIYTTQSIAHSTTLMSARTR